MSILAGQQITAARLNWDSGGTTLSDQIPVATGLQDWGTETVTFPNPGIPVNVTAQLTGRLLGSVNGTTGNVQVEISFDGGATFTVGNNPQLNTTEAAATYRAGCAASHHREGTPTGDIVVKARCNPSATTVSFRSGFIIALMVPQ